MCLLVVDLEIVQVGLIKTQLLIAVFFNDEQPLVVQHQTQCMFHGKGK